MQEYKSLYAAVTICATLVDQKFDFLHFYSCAWPWKAGKTTGESVSWCTRHYTYGANLV